MTAAFPAVRAEERPDLLAPGSPAHRVLAEPLFYLYGLPGFMVPLLHPATAAATMQMDRVFTDPDADLVHFALRLRDTTEMIAGVGRADESDHIAFAMRQLHRDVSGNDTRGASYHAWSREIWTWNWAAIVSALMNEYAGFRGWPSEQFRDDAYLGLVEVGRRFGVLGMPSSYAELAATWPRERDRVADPDNATLQRLHGFITAAGLPRPRGLRWLPLPLWAPLSLPIRHVLRVSLLNGLTEDELAMIGFRRRRLDRVAVASHRAFWRLALPRPVGYRVGVLGLRAHERWGRPVWRTRFSAAALPTPATKES
jgi:uncharacterized protein (DUF2236 family)